MRKSVFVSVAALIASASAANAQLVFGTTTTSTSNPAAVYLDVTTGVTTTLWNSVAQKKVNGLAADTVNGRIYSNDAARLAVWNYGSVGTGPTVISALVRTQDNVTFNATGVDGLAFTNNTLYASTSFGSTIYKRGIYTVASPDVNGRSVMSPLWLDPTGVGTLSGTVQFGGLEYNPSDNKFWVTNGTDTTATGGTLTRGLFTIDAFGSGAMTKIANFPLGRTQIDGLAFGGGKFWLTEQDPANNRVNIYPYNPATNSYEATITFALADPTQRASGATWAPGALNVIPGPSSLAILAFGGLAARRKRA